MAIKRNPKWARYIAGQADNRSPRWAQGLKRNLERLEMRKHFISVSDYAGAFAFSGEIGSFNSVRYVAL